MNLRRNIIRLTVPLLLTAGTVTGFAAVASAAPAANLNCSERWSGTDAWGTCSGTGTWRVHAVCPWWDPDAYSGWINQNGGTVTQHAQCILGGQVQTVYIESQ